MTNPRLPQLPTELLLEIFQYLDDDGLYNLGLACRDLNFPSFSTFLKRHHVQDPSSGGHLYAYDAPPRTLSIIQASLWIKQLQSITYSINPGCDALFDDVANLRRLIKRSNTLYILRLYFHNVDSWAALQRGSRIDGKAWVEQITALFNLAIERGCQHLEISSGSFLKRVYFEDEPSGTPVVDSSIPILKALSTDPPDLELAAIPDQSKMLRRDALDIPRNSMKKKNISRSIKNTVSRIFGGSSRSVAPPSPPLPAATSLSLFPPPCHLNGVFIQSPMLLQYSFYLWTIQMLANGSSTITRLTLSCPDIPSETWSNFLPAITLRVLNHLEISTDLSRCGRKNDEKPKFDDLFKFFQRHPSISRLTMHAVELPEPPLLLDESILPNLKSLVAHPAWIKYFVGLLRSHPDALLHFDSIGITSDYAFFSDAAIYTQLYEVIEDALRQLVDFPRHITLTFRLSSQVGMSAWFEEQASFGTENALLSQLRCVTTFVMSSRFLTGIGRELACHLVPWLALFPALEYVKFTDMSDEVNGYVLIDDTALLKKLAIDCPTVKRVETTGNVVILDTLRDLKEEDSAVRSGQ